MPMLRGTHAHHRDLSSRAETDVTRATTGAGRMTDRLSQIINPRWLLRAEPDQATCADQVSAGSQTTNPPSPAGSAWRLGWEARICSLVQKAKRPAETAVVSIVSELYP